MLIPRIAQRVEAGQVLAERRGRRAAGGIEQRGCIERRSIVTDHIHVHVVFHGHQVRRSGRVQGPLIRNIHGGPHGRSGPCIVPVNVCVDSGRPESRIASRRIRETLCRPLEPCVVVLSRSLASAKGDAVDALNVSVLRAAGTRRPRLGALDLGLVAGITRRPQFL